MHWKQATFVALDFETTGRGNKSEKVGVCEVGAVLVFKGAVMSGSVYTTLINPEEQSTDVAYHIHKLRFSELQNYPSFKQQQEGLEAFLLETVVVAHYAKCEKRVFQKAGMRINPILDTCTLARKLKRGLESYKLSNLVRGLGLREHVDRSYLPERGRGRRFHTAYYDALATAHLFLHLMETGKPSSSLEELRKLCG